MGEKLEIITALHRSTQRDVLARMQDEKVHCMGVAKRYGADYWDGERRYGYGGYRYDGRWEAVARALIEKYGLSGDAKILDVGCGKGYLLYEFTRLLPNCEVRGFDLSEHALSHAKEEIAPGLFRHRAEQAPYPFDDGEFDLVLSITTLHNLPVFHLKSALEEIERVGRNKYVAVESYRDDRELFNLQCWALTCEAFFSEKEWVWLFSHFGYSGDYEFIYF